MGMTASIEVVGLGYRIGEADLIADVDLTVEPGELVAVVGPNGAGKTTLLGLIGGDLVPTSGSITVAGHRPTETGLLATERAVLPQHHVLQFAFRCLDVVMLGRHPHPTGEEEDRVAALRAMDRTDTAQLADRLFTTLSGGEQTRVSFARILAQATPIVLLDEPTSSLDLRHQELVMSTLRGIALDGGSVVAVLHDLNLAARYSDRVVLMSEGRIRAAGRPSDVFTGPMVSEVYAHPVRVIPHPELGTPLVLPIGGESG
jgi:iron complex transport system ATP-binding protein